MKTVKQLLSKFSDLYLALLAYRASPLNNGYSPSELLMGRRLRTTISVLPEILEPKLLDKESVNEWEEKQKRSQFITTDTGLFKVVDNLRGHIRIY